MGRSAILAVRSNRAVRSIHAVRQAVAAMALTAGLCGLGGCQNKMYEENQQLHDQNRELQAQNDAYREMNTRPEPKVAEPTPPAPEPAKPTPPPPAPAPSTDLGGDVTVDEGAGTTTVNFVGDALFDSGKATLKESAKANLDKMVAALKNQYAGKPVQVQGHSDSDPIRVSKWKSNQELSEARAKSVRDYLVSKGVESGRVTAEGFGDSKPKGSDKSKNRRVEIVVMTR